MAKRTPGQSAQYQRAYREQRKATGLCTDCGDSPAEPGKTKCTAHLRRTGLWWASNREYGRENQRRIRERRRARTPEQVVVDQRRLRPDGLKLCKRRAAHPGPIALGLFWPALDEADGLGSVCKACSVEAYKRRAEKHWRSIGLAFQCVYCGGPYEHVDHVVPRRLGGTDEVTNLAPSCARCNQEKNGRPLDAWRPGFALALTI